MKVFNILTIGAKKTCNLGIKANILGKNLIKNIHSTVTNIKKINFEPILNFILSFFLVVNMLITSHKKNIIIINNNKSLIINS
tara:strand:+ start:86 stop:334 length:249 start_codon:yes stop_codon:yes gene_type:complete